MVNSIPAQELGELSTRKGCAIVGHENIRETQERK